MIKTIPIVVALAACGGGAKSTSTTSNKSTDSLHSNEMSAEVIEGKPADENTLARRQAIEAARAAGILGPAPQDTATEPTLDKTAIRTAVRARIVSIQICYEQQLLEKPTLAGTTLVDFTIGADGSVAAASGAGFDAVVDGCVVDVIKKITFPKPMAGKMSVRYPFTFKPAS